MTLLARTGIAAYRMVDKESHTMKITATDKAPAAIGNSQATVHQGVVYASGQLFCFRMEPGWRTAEQAKQVYQYGSGSRSSRKLNE